MPPLSWNEIRDRALRFSREWADESSERSESQTFWNQFFDVFGITRRRIASFETPVRREHEGGYIDLLWKGVLLVEHKSRGRNLDRAYGQALDYFSGLQERALPQYVLVSDFARFRLYDLDLNEQHEFLLEDLPSQIHLFGFIAGYQTRNFGQQDPVNVVAAEKLGRLHDQLKASGYDGHALEVFLVRILFCLFAEDTALFERCAFQDYLELRTHEDGSDLGMHLAQIFQVLNTPEGERSEALDEQLAALPYVNGQLFAEVLPIASCNRSMRDALLECCALDWSRISPAVFGALFQSIMDSRARRNLGAHYTSETHILRLLGPLFLDDLKSELQRIRRNPRRLREFIDRLANLNFFDPACGCGNFLVIAYRELRLLELEALSYVQRDGQMTLDIDSLIGVNVDQFHGIEIEEWPARIAEVALWLTDHQMNLLVSQRFGLYFARLPLRNAPHIIHGNALQIEWQESIPPDQLNYILGNPPFVGAKYMNAEQKADRGRVFGDLRNVGLLDFVTCWYRKAADFMALNPAVQSAFVSTNSITQGEQAGVLWPDLFASRVRINFAHRTFQWSSEARGRAAVHCVIVGFSLREAQQKWIYEYESVRGEPHVISATIINPYLVDAPEIVLSNRSHPICDVPEIGIGNKPIDNGNYLFTDEEKAAFLEIEPQAEPFFRRWIGSREFINRAYRWCLWLGHCEPEELRRMPESMRRVEAVRQFRLDSRSAPTRRLATTPTRFHVENMPEENYLIIPEVSSEKRLYIPIGFLEPSTLSSNLVKIMPGATLYHFGVLSSAMHNSWMRSVCGRMKSDYRYSVGIVYNNFPWPSPNENQRADIEVKAQMVLDARENHANSSLADLYDPLTMPEDLVQAHNLLDQAVDRAYGRRRYRTEAERVAYLFELYQQYINGISDNG